MTVRAAFDLAYGFREREKIDDNHHSDDLLDLARRMVLELLGPETPDLNRLGVVCSECGSSNVEWLDWVKANTSEPTATYEGTETYCPECEENDLGTTDAHEWFAERGITPNLKCDDMRCRGWCHMDDSMGRGPGVERCDTCSMYPDDTAAIEAHDRECEKGAACEYRQPADEE